LIKIVPSKRSEEKTLEELGSLFNNIIMAQKIKDPSCQNILVRNADKSFSWQNFYLRAYFGPRTRYRSVEEAIESRHRKGHEVFVFTNKTDFRSAIQTR
jgi:hypothetical protein